jgi:hypothetical protein
MFRFDANGSMSQAGGGEDNSVVILGPHGYVILSTWQLRQMYAKVGGTEEPETQFEVVLKILIDNATWEKHQTKMLACIEYNGNWYHYNNKITCIKLVRDRYGIGLKESKELVERVLYDSPPHVFLPSILRCHPNQ